jgi:hypothetical protein
LSKTEALSQLSRKFKQVTANFNVANIKERLLSPEQLQDDELSDEHSEGAADLNLSHKE